MRSPRSQRRPAIFRKTPHAKSKEARLVLGYTIAFVLSCVLTLLLLIWAAPRRYQVKISRKLNAPASRVWAYLSEPERYPHWFPYVASCKLDGGPPSGVGQKRRLKLDRNG